MALNLHRIANRAIRPLHPNETVMLYRSAGKQNVLGEIKTIYDDPVQVKAQIQSKGDDALYHEGAVGKNDTIRNCYLFSSSATDQKPTGINRPFSRTGDMLQFSDGTWWLVTAQGEDFSRAGWVNVTITQQVNGPDNQT